MKDVYLLSEESTQVDYITKAKYLYTSDFNKKLVDYLDLNQKKYYYISMAEGIIDPDQDLAPYAIKTLKGESLGFWNLLAYQWVKNLCVGIPNLHLWYSGNTFSGLERLLRDDFNVFAPIKGFVSKDLKMRWINDLITVEIGNRLERGD